MAGTSAHEIGSGARSAVSRAPWTTRDFTVVKQPSPRIVAIGGGTGLPVVLEGLGAHAQGDSDAHEANAITGVVTVTDDGGSSGKLRREFGVLPPGDIRNCLCALADPDSPFKRLLQHRFDTVEGMASHPLGNLLLAALAQITGDFPEAVDRLSEMIGLRGRILPTTKEDVVLRAELETGEVLSGQQAIVASRAGIRCMTLDPSPRPLPEVLHALVNADGIVVGPGSLYTSLIPNLLVEGIASTMFAVKAVRIYVANLTTEPGETDGYSLDDHLKALRMHTGYDLFDYILVDRRPLNPAGFAPYAARGAHPVKVDLPLEWAGQAELIECDLGVDYRDRDKIRHQPASLARAVRALVRAGRL